MTQGRLSVAIIGAGPVGAVLGQALASAGHMIAGIASTNPKNIERAETMLPGALVKTLPQLLELADLVLFAIPADQLEATIGGISEAKLWRSGQLVAHTSAQFGYSVFNSAAQQGVIPLAIHPAMSFTGTSVDLARIRESHFAVSAPAVALPIAQALVIEMGAEPLVISEDNRAIYFEAISVAANFSAMIVNQAIGLLESVGIDDARSVLSSVVRSSVEVALAAGHKPIDPSELLG